MNLFFPMFFLAFLFIVLPRAAWRSRRVLQSTAGASITRTRIYVSTFFSMFFVGVMTFLTASQTGINLLPRYHFTARDALVIIAALVLKLPVGLIRLRTGRVLPRTQNLAPRTAREGAMAIALVAQTAIVEECAYRGVAFTILTWYTGNAWIAAALGASAFGLAHLVQGNKAAFVAGLHGLSDQAVVALTGTLYPAMIVHFLYDTIFGAALSAHAQKRERAELLQTLDGQTSAGI